ncbi:hypothetical protein GMRT_14217 [Giardia muris]|uniref:Uncharacterized protein n=1 Tax=Giardia muris TaxID=5742 RepID=A0A4Z1SWX1_GIAMU|nr:hypothetical protein GMRT_14217 [Giardia muris]|eukprot:TNJ30244.1 hypothetical protein GMRT_14217 [Giardia muris]
MEETSYTTDSSEMCSASSSDSESSQYLSAMLRRRDPLRPEDDCGWRGRRRRRVCLLIDLSDSLESSTNSSETYEAPQPRPRYLRRAYHREPGHVIQAPLIKSLELTFASLDTELGEILYETRKPAKEPGLKKLASIFTQLIWDESQTCTTTSNEESS